MRQRGRDGVLPQHNGGRLRQLRPRLLLLRRRALLRRRRLLRQLLLQTLLARLLLRGGCQHLLARQDTKARTFSILMMWPRVPCSAGPPAVGSGTSTCLQHDILNINPIFPLLPTPANPK